MAQNTVLCRKKAGLWQSILLAFLLALAVFVIFKSPVFDVKEIEVHGNRQVSKEKIIAASGIHTGVNIFKVNLKDASASLGALPVFKQVGLKRSFPGRVVITVEERNPVALLPEEKGYIVIDNEQVYIRKSQTVLEDLPVLTGIETNSPGPGEVVEGEGLQATLQVIRELPAELTGRLSEVHYQRNGSIVLYTVEGNQCRFGNPVEIKAKGDVFLQLLREFEQNNKQIEYVDLSFVGSPVVKYK